MTKRKKTTVAAFAILGIAVVGLAAGVYAKYIASISGTSNASIAKWAFESENGNNVQNVTCDPTGTYKAGSLTNGKMAPGTVGECKIDLTNNESEVGVDYTIVLSADAVKPANLKFYSDSNYSTELTASGITGHLDVKGTDTKSVYWKWAYSTSDADDLQDTQSGKAAADGNANMTITLQVSGVQTKPTE